MGPSTASAILEKMRSRRASCQNGQNSNSNLNSTRPGTAMTLKEIPSNISLLSPIPLEDRREKLRDLLQLENQLYKQSMNDIQNQSISLNTKEIRQKQLKILREKHNKLKKQKEEERRKKAQELMYEQFKKNCPELRDIESS